MNFDMSFALSILPSLWKASILALAVAVASAALASGLGLVLELGRRSSAIASRFISFLIDLVRVTPLIVQLYFAYFVLPRWGIVVPPIILGITCLGVHYSSYLAEVFKAALDAIPKGQFEAAAALGLSNWQTTLRVTVPLIFRNAIPAMSNYFLTILKATPYLAVISVNELLGTALTAASDTYRYYEPFALLGVFFLAYSLTITFLVNLFRKRTMRMFGEI